MEEEWQTLNDYKSPNDSLRQNNKHIDDYNRNIDDILSQLKADKKLQDIYSPSIKKRVKNDDMRDFEKEVKMLQEKNNIRRSYITDKYHEKDKNGVHSVKIEIKPKYFDYSSLERKRMQTNILDGIEHKVKKGAWRKDMARYEEDLELSKLRNETEKKIYNLDKETIKYTDENVKLIPVKILRSKLEEQKQKTFKDFKSLECKETVLIKNKIKNNSNITDTSTSFKRKDEEGLDASLTIKPVQIESLNENKKNSVDYKASVLIYEKSSKKFIENADLYRVQDCKTKNIKEKKESAIQEINESRTPKETFIKKEINEGRKPETNKSADSEKKPTHYKPDVGKNANIETLTTEKIDLLKTDDKEKDSQTLSELGKKRQLNNGAVDAEKKNPKETSCEIQHNSSSNNGQGRCDGNVTEKEEGVKEEEEGEDVSGMKAMRKETNDAFANMEAEFEAGRSKLAALRARIRKARELSKVAIDE